MRHAFIAAGLLLAVGFVLFPGAGRDDMYLTYWPAHALCHYGEVVNYNGEHLEQSSSLMHVFALALLCRFGLTVPVAGYLLGIVCGVLTVFATGRLAAQVSDAPRVRSAAMWLAASCTSLVYWSFGGLEGSLAACIGATWLWLANLTLREPRSPARIGWLVLLTAALVLVRPEAAVVALVSCIMFFAWALYAQARGPAVPALAWRIAAVTGSVLAVMLAIMALRLHYFGSAFPQPVTAKHQALSFGTLKASIKAGLKYAFYAYAAWPLMAVAAIGLVGWFRAMLRSSIEAAPRALIAAYALAYCAFVIAVGGDWMEGGRFFVPLVPVFAVIAADGLNLLWSAQRANVIVAIVCIAALAESVQFARSSSMSLPLWQAWALPPEQHTSLAWFETINREHHRDEQLVNALRDAVERVHPEPAHPMYVLLENTGMSGYYLMLEYFRRVRFVDMHGLSDRYMTRAALHYDAGPLGINCSPHMVLHDFAIIQKTSAIPKPTLLVWQDRGKESLAWQAEVGYATEYLQTGAVLPPPLWGKQLRTEQHVSVDAATAARLAFKAPIDIPTDPPAE